MSYLDNIPGLLPRATAESMQVLRDNVPAELRALPTWVAADRSPKTQGNGTVKSSKKPINPRTGRNAMSSEPSTWGTFDEAVSHALVNEKCFGVGVNLLGTEFLGLDLDDVIDAETGDLNPAAKQLIDALPPTYIETSPSGRGLRMFYRGSKPEDFASSKLEHAFGEGADLEVYDRSAGRYLTVTGRVWGGEARPIATLSKNDLLPVLALFEDRAFQSKPKKARKQKQAPQPPGQETTPPSPRDMQRAKWGLLVAKLLDPDKGYDSWFRVGVALKSLGDEGLRLWDEWSRTSQAYDANEITAKWPGLTGSSVASLFGMFDDASKKWRADFEQANDHAADAEPSNDDFEAEQNGLVPLGGRDPETGRLVLSARRTQPTAIAFVRQFAMPQGLRTLHSYVDELFEWKGNRYVHLPDAAASQRLLSWLARAVIYQKDRDGNFYLAAFPANPSTVKAALQSVHMHVYRDLDEGIPCWLDGRTSPPPSELVPCRNGTLHVPTRTLYEPDPRLFNTNALDFDYDPNAAAPTRWLQFLDEVLGEDVQARNLLQEWMGYCLVADTSQQKILLIVGPRRSGKGTIGRVLHALVGAKNVVNPTVGVLSGSFGLQPLLDKSVAVISDARFSGPNVHVVTERLLTISGEDAVTIDRKHKESVTVRLQTRFVVLTNELPTLQDASAALAGRFVTVQLRNSFYGNEDPGLGQKLKAELPGILLWALDGWQRLHERGRFEQPDSALEANEDIEDLASPARAFVRDCCERGAGLRVTQDALYEQFRWWCGQEGREHIPPKPVFARDLNAAFQLKVRRDTNQCRFYDGIGLAPRGDA